MGKIGGEYMNERHEATAGKPDARYLLSELLDAKVILSDKKIGRLSDLVIVETGTFPVSKIPGCDAPVWQSVAACAMGPGKKH